MIDIDKLFEKYFRKFISENVGKFSEDELESKVGELYARFGDAPLSELGNLSPREYFKRMSDAELVVALKDCVDTGVAVSDFLCDELSERKNAFDGLVGLIETQSDELSTYCVNIIRYNERINDALPILLSVLVRENCGDSLAETITEVLGESADFIKDNILSLYYNYPKAQKYLIDIISKCSVDDRVTDLLIKEFKAHDKEYYVYAGYLGKYGDERALDSLYDVLKIEKLPYIDYKEVKQAIEELGGVVEQERDYGSDKIYKKLH